MVTSNMDLLTHTETRRFYQHRKCKKLCAAQLRLTFDTDRLTRTEEITSTGVDMNKQTLHL